MYMRGMFNGKHFKQIIIYIGFTFHIRSLRSSLQNYYARILLTKKGYDARPALVHLK